MFTISAKGEVEGVWAHLSSYRLYSLSSVVRVLSLVVGFKKKCLCSSFWELRVFHLCLPLCLRDGEMLGKQTIRQLSSLLPLSSKRLSVFRCLSVINPLRSESRSAGSWRGLLVNFRLLLLFAYDRALQRFEEIIREKREKRNQPGWSFCNYFLLQVFC